MGSLLWSKEMKYFKGIITADWHLSQTRPRCRIDNDWIETQRNMVNQVYEYANKFKVDVFIVGDIFHSNSDTSFEVIKIVQDFAKELKKIGLKLYVIFGNHDLLFHSVANVDKSAVGILMNSENVYFAGDYSDEVGAGHFNEKIDNKRIVFKHILCFESKEDVPFNVDAVTAQELLDEYDNAKYICLGDNHHSFIYENKGRKVINSGCLMRRNSNFKDYKPIIVYVNEEEEICKSYSITDNEEFVDDSYILKQEEREQRIESFVDKLKDTKKVSLDFIDNVKKAMQANKLSEEMVLMLEELLEV